MVVSFFKSVRREVFTMLYPINLELNHVEIVVIGGGEVAYRKCKNFSEFNKSVKVVAPSFIELFYKLENVELIWDSYKEEYIQLCSQKKEAKIEEKEATKIYTSLNEEEYNKMAHAANPDGDGKACERIINQIIEYFKKK